MTPAEATLQKKNDEARRRLAWAKQLEKCEGWKAWLGPKIFGSYDAAKDAILAQAAKGEKPSQIDLDRYAALHDIVSAFRDPIIEAKRRIGDPSP